jgi:hypothetical protein
MKIGDPLQTLQNFAEAYDINVEERKSTLNEIAAEIDARDTYKRARMLKAVADPTRLKIIKALCVRTHGAAQCTAVRSVTPPAHTQRRQPRSGTTPRQMELPPTCGRSPRKILKSA